MADITRQRQLLQLLQWFRGNWIPTDALMQEVMLGRHECLSALKAFEVAGLLSQQARQSKSGRPVVEWCCEPEATPVRTYHRGFYATQHQAPTEDGRAFADWVQWEGLE